jgi:hypothetical protein
MKANEQKSKKAAPAAAKTEPITPEVMSRDPLAPGNMSEAQMTQVKAMLGQVSQDLANAQLGKFYALRAGIGLKAMKGQFEHGSWEGFLAATFPAKSMRTLRRYQSDAERFFELKGTTAEKSWAAMFASDAKLIDRAATQLLLPAKDQGTELAIPKREIPKIVREMAEFIAADGEDENSGPREIKEAKQLSSRERLQAVNDMYNSVLSKLTQEVVASRSWTVLPVETQESIAASLRTNSEEIMRNVRKTKQTEDQKKS